MEAVAKLQNVPTSPRKMRLVADMIRGKKVSSAINMLKFEPKVGARYMEKLLLSAVANWEVKHEDFANEIGSLVVKTVFVDGGKMLKRIQPAPQGRAHRVRKRSNHITLVVGLPSEGASLADMTESIANQAAEQAAEALESNDKSNQE
ncbi:50S ribosomal protein L22 [Bernardetia sp. OM2101]|jgi:large subunit ribosomal protein L22|uniref:Large ribosomal subunit protein uL22 n=1 Tax=Bernardetia litoralis (strain ATCC 23117 / DSM 6794 / NBRC 15988 / NCIMB 1366 / Fx l1 / Sio-4) TaxID=880071 RepID=I4ANK2_BERLS|nr:50S ribosomal protein L22 [Bernardetia litoralis]AFM05537.1 LSU ribosomal protein L22P [Bernardetia litoralis DSM 6794]